MRVTIAILLCFLLKVSSGQNNYALQITAVDQPATFFQKKLAYQNRFKDSIQAKAEAVNLLNRIQSAGYVAASVDSISADTLQMVLYIYVGQKFESIIIKNGNVDEKLLGDAGIKNWVLKGLPLQPAQVQIVKDNLVRACENSGYPFAGVRLDSFTQEDKQVSARVYINKNELMRFDTLHILGKTKTKRVFLKNYLGIKPNKPYNEATILKIGQRLRNLQFVEPIQPHTVVFQNGKAIVNLYLKDKKASQFDFLVGFLPGSSGQKLLVTGEANLHLFSMFGVGEEFYLKWQKLQPKTQTLDVKLVYPYLVGLPLGINASFNLYKRDTSYVDINGDYGIQYQMVGNSYLKASLKQRISIITNVDTNYIRLNKALPTNLDVTSNSFALEYYLQRLDYRFNPTAGYQLTINGSAGIRKIRKSATIASLFDEARAKSFEYLYDSIRLTSFEFRVGLAIDKYWRLAPRHTIKTSAEAKYFYSRNIYDNEKYRIGGMNSLRGFDDQSIFTPYYAMANLEYRFLLSKNSFFGVFFNAAVVENILRRGTPDYPFGFGTSAAIETKAGVFGITYAMGRQLNNKITFNSAKIHFGYVNYF